MKETLLKKKNNKSLKIVFNKILLIIKVPVKTG